MASIEHTSSMGSQSSPPRPIQRKPIPIPKLVPEPNQRENFAPGQRAGSPDDSPRLRGSPISPVRLTFRDENLPQPSNGSIEGPRISRDSYADKELPRSPDVPPPPPYKAVEEHPQKRPEVQDTSDAYGKALPAEPHQDDPNASKSSRNHDPNRQSRESDTTASTQQQTSADSSSGTNPSSVSQDASESQVLSDEASQEESIIEGETSGNTMVPQLQYHHQPSLPLPRTGSVPLGTDSRHSSTTDLAKHGSGIDRHLTPNSVYQRRSSMPRPASSYSLISSPGYGPHGRSASSNLRRSPETRPVSYAELLNVPYPQPAPAPLSIDNSRLRNNVGSNASLLSAQKTLDMYRQNVRKTNDFSIQYSFAVFLISTAQEQGFTYEEPTKKRVVRNGGDSGASPDGRPAESTPAELVREAKTILTRLANGGYPFAQYYLADGYASGLFNKGKEDYNAAFPLFVLAAKHGHAESGYRAGLCYEFGWGCRKDPAKAVQYLRTAASRGHPGAMTRLGKACLSGDLGENRYREGIKWLKRATEASDAMYNGAPYQLGVLYETGYGDDIFKDESYAAELFTQAAELGHAEANYRMGDAYEHGKLNCPRDPALSVHFYTGAAERGHAAAMMGLCAWYMVGADPILEKDEEEAYEWARRSADLGLVKAQYAVGYFTEMGIGCRRDILEANVWYVKAADAGDERAKQRLAAIRAAVSGGGNVNAPMEVAPPRNAKMKKANPKDAKDDKDCTVM